MKTLIIGQHFFVPILTQTLKDHGHSVHHFVDGQLWDESIDVVYDLTYMGWPKEFHRFKLNQFQHQRFFEIKNIITQCKLIPPKAYIYCSDLLLFGNQSSWVSEENDLNPIGYSQIEEKAFRLFQEEASKGSVPLINVCTGWIYGSSPWFLKFMKQIRKGKNPMWTECENYWSLIHEEDCARFLTCLGEYSPVGDDFILCDDQPVPLKKLIQFLGGCYRKEIKFKSMPWTQKMIQGKVVFDSYQSSVRAKNDKMKSVIGFALDFPNYQDGIAYTLAKIAEKEKVI